MTNSKPLLTRHVGSVPISLGLAVVFVAVPALAKEAVEVHPVLGPIGTNDHRMPFHVDSVIGLALVAYAVAVTMLLNHAQPKARVWGVWGATLGCLGIAGSVFYLHMVGAFSEVRPPLLPVDGLKPSMMRIMGVLFAGAGLLLGLVAIGQTRRADVRGIPVRNAPSEYGRMARYYHWSIAILFLLLVPMGIFTSMIPVEQEYRQAYYVIHKSLGLTVLLLAIGRLIWLIINPAPKLDPSLSGWEKLLAHGAHYTLYFFLFAFPISGFVLSTFGGKLSHFFFWDTPLLWRHSLEGTKLPALMHKVVLPYLFYLVFLGHILGALKHRFLDKHADAFRRMVT